MLRKHIECVHTRNENAVTELLRASGVATTVVARGCACRLAAPTAALNKLDESGDSAVSHTSRTPPAGATEMEQSCWCAGRIALSESNPGKQETSSWKHLMQCVNAC